MLDNLWSFIAANPILVLAICFLIYKQWEARQPWPDFGGNIISLKSVDEWNDMLSKADAAGKVVHGLQQVEIEGPDLAQEHHNPEADLKRNVSESGKLSK